jgi:hypothetical protein
MSKFFHRGKEARSLGHDRALKDGRVTPANRRDFYEGWDEQDRYMRPKPTPEEQQESEEALSGIRAFLNQNRSGSNDPHHQRGSGEASKSGVQSAFGA